MLCATVWNTMLGLEKQVLWWHGTSERIELDKGTNFWKKLIDTWTKEHGIEWVYHIRYHAPISGKTEWYNTFLKTTLRAMRGTTFRNWDSNLGKATWLVNIKGSTNRTGPAQSELPHTVEWDKIPVVQMKNVLGKTVWVTRALGKDKPIHGIAFTQRRVHFVGNAQGWRSSMCTSRGSDSGWEYSLMLWTVGC